MFVTILFVGEAFRIHSVGEDTFHFAVAFRIHSVGVDTDQAFHDVAGVDIVVGAYHPSSRLESEVVVVDILPFHQNLDGRRSLVLDGRRNLVLDGHQIHPFVEAFLWAFPLGGHVEVQAPSSY